MNLLLLSAQHFFIASDSLLRPAAGVRLLFAFGSGHFALGAAVFRTIFVDSIFEQAYRPTYRSLSVQRVLSCSRLLWPFANWSSSLCSMMLFISLPLILAYTRFGPMNCSREPNGRTSTPRTLSALQRCHTSSRFEPME